MEVCQGSVQRIQSWKEEAMWYVDYFSFFSLSIPDCPMVDRVVLRSAVLDVVAGAGWLMILMQILLDKNSFMGVSM